MPDYPNEDSSAVPSHAGVAFIYCVVLTFESVDEILWCDHSNETFSAVLSFGHLVISTILDNESLTFFRILTLATNSSDCLRFLSMSTA